MQKVIEFIEEFLREHRKSIIVLLLLVSITGGLLGLRYYKKIRTDPDFCATCHMMQESYKGWQLSSHRDIICQKCHRLSLSEQNKLLMTYVITGYTEPREQAHGKVEPWNSCRECHLLTAQQGSVSMRKSYGHARHVFMQEIDCADCHSAQLHNFAPDEKSCQNCHEDKLVHGLGMAGLTCLNCHSFGAETARMVSDKKCFGCHEEMPRAGPMASFHCFACHKPHGKIQLTNADCLGNCHGNEATVGQHGLHMEKTELGCLDCHKAHSWTVGEKEAPGLCDRCHATKDPRTFIY